MNLIKTINFQENSIDIYQYKNINLYFYDVSEIEKILNISDITIVFPIENDESININNRSFISEITLKKILNKIR